MVQWHQIQVHRPHLDILGNVAYYAWFGQNPDEGWVVKYINMQMTFFCYILVLCHHYLLLISPPLIDGGCPCLAASPLPFNLCGDFIVALPLPSLCFSCNWPLALTPPAPLSHGQISTTAAKILPSQQAFLHRLLSAKADADIIVLSFWLWPHWCWCHSCMFFCCCHCPKLPMKFSTTIQCQCQLPMFPHHHHVLMFPLYWPSNTISINVDYCKVFFPLKTRGCSK